MLERSAQKRRHDWLSFRGMLVLWLLVGLNFAGLQAIGDTIGYFNDTETSVQNIFKGSEVDFLASATVQLLTSSVEEEYVEDGYEYSVTLTPQGEGGFQYVARAADHSGRLCNALKLRALRRGVPVFAGFLTDFLTDPIPVTSPEEWNFKITRLSDGLEGICAFDLEFAGWQDGLATPLAGHNDIESLHQVVNYTEPGEDVQTSPLLALSLGGGLSGGPDGEVLGDSTDTPLSGDETDATSTPTTAEAGQASTPPVDPDTTSQGGGGGPSGDNVPAPSSDVLPDEPADATSTPPTDENGTDTPTSTDSGTASSEPAADEAAPPADEGTPEPPVPPDATMSEPKKEEPPITPDVVEGTTDPNGDAGGNNAPQEPEPSPSELSSDEGPEPAPEPPPPSLVPEPEPPPLVIDIVPPPSAE